jgi:DNA-binding CsgD family transcriptional regulator
MAHVVVFIDIVILLVGTWCIFYAYTMSKTYTYPFLQPLVLFVVFSNLLVLTGLITHYCCANILGKCLLSGSSFYNDKIDPFASLFVIGRTCAFIGVVLGFQGITPSSKLKSGFLAGMITLALSYGIRIFSSPLNPWIKNLANVHLYLYIGAISLFFASLIVLLISGIRARKKEDSRMQLSFGLFYLLTHIILMASHWFNLAPQVFSIYTILLLFNIFPIIWLKHVFLPFHRQTGTANEDSALLEILYQKFNISRREREIVELILQGKSNKEIEDSLFISLSTVKNHIYNVYQKLGVKSRSQLIRLILESQRMSDDFILNGR